MNNSNELYGLTNSSYTLHGKSFKNTNNGTVSYTENSLTIYHDEKTLTINNQSFNLIDSISTKTHTIMLCVSKAQSNYKNFIYVYEYSSGTCYSLLINTDVNIFERNHTMFFKEHLYIINDLSKCLVINILDKTIAVSNISPINYPTGELYNAYTITSYELPIKSYSNRAIYSYDNIFIPINLETNIIKLSAKNNTLDLIELERENYEPFDDVRDIIPCLIDQEDNESCIVACIASNNKIMMMDLIDLSSYVINTYSKKVTILKKDSDIYMLSNSLGKVNPKEFDIISIPLESDISTFDFSTINNNIVGRSTTQTKQLIKYDNFSVINVICINGNGDVIYREQKRYQRDKLIDVTSPSIQGYTLEGESTKSITTSEDIMFVYFKYTVTKPKSLLNVYHMNGKEILHEEVIEGIVGEKYKINSLTIPGFYYYDSLNTTGVFKASNENCIIYYTSESFHTDNDNNSFVCVNCMCENNYIIKKYIPVKKGLNIEVTLPIVKGYSSSQSTITIPSIDKDIHVITAEYTKNKEVIPVYFKIGNYTVFENTALVNNEMAELEYPDFLKPNTTYARVNGNKFVIINTTPIKPITIVNIINKKTSNILHYLIKTTKTPNIVPLDIINMNYKETVKNNLYDATIITLTYEQNLYETIVVHKYQNTVLKTETLYNKFDDIIKIKPYDDPDYITSDSLSYKVIEDKTLYINYTYKTITVTTTVIDIINNKNIYSKTYIYKKDDEKIVNVPIDETKYKILYKDTSINSNEIINTSTNAKLIYLVSTTDITPEYFIRYKPGAIEFNYKKTSEKFIAVLSTNNSPILFTNKVYVVNDIDKDNTSTKTLLTTLKIPFEEILSVNVNSITSPCILIDGDISKSISFLPNSYIPNDDMIYLPMNIKYNDFSNTIKKAYSSLITNDVTITPNVVSTTPYIDTVSYNKITNNMHVLIAADVNYKTLKEFTIYLYDIRELKEVCKKTFNINTIHNFSKAVYCFDSSMNTEPNIKTLVDIDNIKYNNSSKSDVIDIILHCYLMDEIGNRTSTMHQPIVHNITASSTVNSNYSKIHSSNITRYNNRYNGPRESFKFNNTYENCNNNLKQMNDIFETIRSKYNYKDSGWIE